MSSFQASGATADTSDPAKPVTVVGIAELASIEADAAELTTRVLAEAAAGRLRPVVGQTYPLARAAAAHAAIEARQTIGKTLLLGYHS